MLNRASSPDSSAIVAARPWALVRQYRKIPARIASGIAGRVATTGETQNIADPYGHPAFNADVDRRTGYRTHSILCMPILDRHGQVFAVAQLLNKDGDKPFTAEDELAFREFAEPLGLILESCLQIGKA